MSSGSCEVRKRGGWMRTPELTIVSGCTQLRFGSFINHQIFADYVGADYIWSFPLGKTGRPMAYLKLDAIERNIHLAPWTFWIDDDAYFTDFNWNIWEYAKSFDVDLIICKSPINQGRFVWASAGQFFIRRSERSAAFLKAIPLVDLDTVEKWWNPQVFGAFLKSEQCAMTYLLNTDPRFANDDFFVRLDYTEFNTRDFHYSSPWQHRVLHLASWSRSKHDQMREFIDKFGCNEFLVPDEILRQYDVALYQTAASAY